MILATLGFIVLILIALFLIFQGVTIIIGSAFFGGFEWLAAILIAIALGIIWFACHIAPFTITAIGR